MQPSIFAAQSFNRDQLLAIECRQELYAGIDRLDLNTLATAVALYNDDRARTAIPLGTAFLGSRHPQIFTQELQDRARRVGYVSLDL